MINKTSFTIFTIMSLASCSPKDKLYLKRDWFPDKSIGNIIVSIEDDKNALVAILKRTNSGVIKTEELLVKKSKNNYVSEKMSLLINSDNAKLSWENQEILVTKVKKKSKKTTFNSIKKLVQENYVIWENVHQITEFDIREDSICYFYRRPEKVPFKTEKWFLFTIADEYFLTHCSNSNSIPRIQIKGGKMVETQCNGNECKEYVTELVKKEKDRQ
ncbi:MAG: hypothetical protein IPM82_02265 [Saprospiraceae bacterium]|nr:hypothetical protein [Saprospiraceae bacterium]